MSIKMKTVFIALLIAGALGCASLLTPSVVEIDNAFADKAETKRLRWFSEINAPAALATGLTGKGVRVTIMGEMVDPSHEDLKDQIGSQYNSFVRKDMVLKGNDDRAFGDERFGYGDGHGTHIAGTIAAKCDGSGIQGLACGAILDVYDLGAYDNSNRWPTEGWEDGTHEFGRFIYAFATAIDDVTKRGISRITTGSFNLESPAIHFSTASSLNGKSVSEIIQVFEDDIRSVDDIATGNYVVFENHSDIVYLENVIKNNDDDEVIALFASLPLSEEWARLEEAIARYQAHDGVYLVTESNYIFDDRSSTLNAMPTLSDKVDPDLWLSVAMVSPTNFEDLAKLDSQDEIEASLKDSDYETPINSCGRMASEYCILTPSWSVLSTMTERVAERDGSVIFSLDGRLYQVFDVHSMGAPMVAATLALMEE